MKILATSIIVFCLALTTSSSVAQSRLSDLDTLINGLAQTYMTNKEAVGLSIGVYTGGATNFYNYGTTEKA